LAPLKLEIGPHLILEPGTKLLITVKPSQECMEVRQPFPLVKIVIQRFKLQQNIIENLFNYCENCNTEKDSDADEYPLFAGAGVKVSEADGRKGRDHVVS
jgi:hypothetical protein